MDKTHFFTCIGVFGDKVDPRGVLAWKTYADMETVEKQEMLQQHLLMMNVGVYLYNTFITLQKLSKNKSFCN